MASAKDIAVLERKLKEAKSNREKIVLAKELKDLKSKLSTTQKEDTLPTQRRKIRMLSSAEFNELIARLKQKPEYSFLKSMGKKKIQDDYRVVGKPVGWRIKGKGNYKVPSAKFRRENPDAVYYENRVNRSDVRRPNRLEKGGNMDGIMTDNIKQKWNEYVSENGRQNYASYESILKEIRSENRGGRGYTPSSGSSIEYNTLNLLKKLGVLYEVTDRRKPQKQRGYYLKNNEMATGGSLKKKDNSVGSSLADAKKRVAKMSDDEVVEEISTIYHYEMQDNDVDMEELYDDIATARKELAKHYAEQNDSDSYAKGGKMKKSDLVEYVVPNWSVPCLINGDYNGLSDEDEEALENFTKKVIRECGNAWFMLGEKSDDYDFSSSNDVDNYAQSVTTLYIMPDNSYAKGGGVKKKVKTQPEPTPNADVNPMDSYNVELVESQGKDDKGTYYMFPKPADIKSKGILFEKGGQIAVGDWVAEKKGTARGKVYQDTGVFIKLEDKYGNKNNTLYSKSKFKKSVKPRY